MDPKRADVIHREAKHQALQAEAERWAALATFALEIAEAGLTLPGALSGRRRHDVDPGEPDTPSAEGNEPSPIAPSGRSRATGS